MDKVEKYKKIVRSFVEEVYSWGGEYEDNGIEISSLQTMNTVITFIRV